MMLIDRLVASSYPELCYSIIKSFTRISIGLAIAAANGSVNSVTWNLSARKR